MVNMILFEGGRLDKGMKNRYDRWIELFTDNFKLLNFCQSSFAVGWRWFFYFMKSWVTMKDDDISKVLRGSPNVEQ